jgi:hypothetical protein
LAMGPIRCPEISVKFYHSTPRDTPVQRRSNEVGQLALSQVQETLPAPWELPTDIQNFGARGTIGTFAFSVRIH